MVVPYAPDTYDTRRFEVQATWDAAVAPGGIQETSVSVTGNELTRVESSACALV